MGRAFEYRKATKLKRWGNMARVFTKLGKQITIAAREGGPDPDFNPRLRVLIQHAKKENMPKDNVERAIKKAMSRDEAGYEEMVYEGYGPHGVAIVIETATDNSTRTVGNIRSYFNKHGGSLGTTGSLEYLFDRKCVFHIAKKEGIDLDELELELIDYGVDEVNESVGENGEAEIVLYGEFTSYAAIQTYLEENGHEIFSAEFDRIPNSFTELTEEQRESVDKLLEKIEEDEDVQNVFHNIANE
ncbi:MAG: YebC/PmpR family DNA-binding transcriptional regulator [Bacteroidales bacterium]|nr:YebC/PmpR family DNA-binding transcriptional regulator [Bacteroidales bacterium]